nr:retron Ec78 anti-phage system effector HNH endonuclease PtuB [uncultured Roseateles sp.]
MRQLTRGPAPLCLTGFRHGAQNWSDVTPEQKAEIWQSLGAMQGKRCAYCEADISESDRHIEHFVQKGRVPAQTFSWHNLFGSCNREDSCGKHKDAKGRPYADHELIKPDIEDPELLLVFEPHGAVRPRKGLGAAAARRATETMRVFNLDGVLKAIRRSELMGYLQTAEEIAEFFEVDPVLGQQFLAQELHATEHLPFATAIKHVLTRQD